MKTLSAVIALAAVLALPAGAAAKPHDGSAKRAAIAQCKAERGKSKATRRAFKVKHHSFNRCVSERRNAAQECKAERADPDFPATHDGKTFQEFYGTGKRGRNAFGKCVSAKAKAKRAEERAERRNAAQECKAERADPDFPATHDGKSFSDFYGTNANKRNAFGKCVSSKVGQGGDENYVDPFGDDDHGKQHKGRGKGHKHQP